MSSMFKMLYLKNKNKYLSLISNICHEYDISITLNDKKFQLSNHEYEHEYFLFASFIETFL
jgi:hypothetical protein